MNQPTRPSSRGQLVRMRSDMEKCFRCSLCKMTPLPVALHPDFTDACPAARRYHFHGFSGSGKSIMALSLLDGRIEPDAALARTVFACTACGYCDVACKFIMDAERQHINMTLRSLLWDHGLAPEALKKLVAEPHSGGEPWHQGLDVEKLPGGHADVLVIAGASGPADEPARKLARRLALLLRRAGWKVGVLESEPDWGLIDYWVGRGDVFADLARSAVAAVEHSGARRLVTASGPVLGLLKSKYPEVEHVIEMDLHHSSELLTDLIGDDELKLPNRLQGKVTYHDPCYLGRQGEAFRPWRGEAKIALGVMTYDEPPRPVNRGGNGVYDAPRDLLRSLPGLDFVELHRKREYSYCCGGGGGAPEAFPELAESAALHRLEEVRDVGATILATACSHCIRRFEAAQQALAAKDRVRVADVVDLAFEAAGLED